MSEAVDGRRESGRELNRIVNFTDGVFAIVITLLILTIQAPEIPSDSVARELPGRLLDLAPKFLSYVISFLVVAVYWMAHHRVFRPIRGYDRTLLYLNFSFLILLASVPFPSLLLAGVRQPPAPGGRLRYPGRRQAAPHDHPLVLDEG